jgi:hypothetical protein
MDLIENKTINNLEINRHPWEIVRYSIIEHQVSLMAKKTNKSPILIDIGCGDAFVINNLAKKMKVKKAYAIDINFHENDLKSLNQNKINITFLNSIDDIIIEHQESYIILMNDVIEHINKHIEFLEDLKERILIKTANSYLYITVPAFEYLFSKHDLDLGHFRRYTRRQLIDYNKILDFEIVETGYFFFSLFLVRNAQKVFQSVIPKKGPIGVSKWNHGFYVSKLACLVLNLDYKLTILIKKVNINLPGLSTYIIFKK